MANPCRWSARSRFLLRECPLQAPSPSCSSHHHLPEEHGSRAQREQQRNAGSTDYSRQTGNHENIIVRAVLMTEWLSHADVVRSINMLRVVLSVGGCAKMTYGDVCDVPSDYVDTSAQICGHSEKVHGTEADRSQLVPEKCAHKHIRASCSPAMKLSKKVVNEAVAKNLGACHQDETLTY